MVKKRLLLICFSFLIIGCQSDRASTRQSISFETYLLDESAFVEQRERLIEITEVQTKTFDVPNAEEIEYLFFANNHFVYDENAYLYFLNSDSETVAEIEVKGISGYRDSSYIDGHLYLFMSNSLMDFDFNNGEVNYLEMNGIVQKVTKFEGQNFVIFSTGYNNKTACTFDEGLKNLDCKSVDGDFLGDVYKLVLHNGEIYQILHDKDRQETYINLVEDDFVVVNEKVIGEKYNIAFVHDGELILANDDKYFNVDKDTEYEYPIKLTSGLHEYINEDFILRYGEIDDTAYLVQDKFIDGQLYSEILWWNDDYTDVIPFGSNLSGNVTIPVFKGVDANFRLALDISNKSISQELTCPFENGNDQYVFGAYKY